MQQASNLLSTDKDRQHVQRKPFTPRLKIVSRSASHAESIRFLTDEIELRYGIKPTAALSRRLHKLFEHLSPDELAAWAEQLSGLGAADAAWAGLIECLTVHETYFNRDPELMGAIRHQILPELIRAALKSGEYSIRVWSAACSTGEEAYNLAFLVLDTLVEAGQAIEAGGEIVVDPKWRVAIVASDLSGRALEIARDGVYCDHGLGYFRGLPQKMWRFFEGTAGPVAGCVPDAHYWQVKGYLKRHLRFQCCNLLIDPPPESGCDLVVCRNVMIYFDQQATLQVQEMLADAVKPGGFLVQGATDPQLLDRIYHRHMQGDALYYRTR